MKPPFSDVEPLRRQETAQVGAADRLLVAADELGHLERRHQAIGHYADRGRTSDLNCASVAGSIRSERSGFLITPSAQWGADRTCDAGCLESRTELDDCRGPCSA